MVHSADGELWFLQNFDDDSKWKTELNNDKKINEHSALKSRFSIKTIVIVFRETKD